MRAVMKKDPTMRSKLALLALASIVSGCAAGAPNKPDRGLSAVNVPVVTTAEYVFDAAASDGSLAPGEADRLNDWFRGLGVGYGDSIYVDGDYASRARGQVGDIVGRYGLLVSASAPVTAGAVAPGSVRVVVSRRRAMVPNCPNWERGDQPNYENRSMPGLGCAVNSNFAAMVADPVDLIHGREGSGLTSPDTVTKAIEAHRKATPTGNKSLQSVNTKGN